MLGALPFPLAGVRIIRLFANGVLSSLATFTRTQAGGALSTNQTSEGSWVEVGANTPRVFGPDLELLIEPQRTNAIRNPRLEGGTVGLIGGAGAWPTNVEVVNNNFAGFTATINSFQKVSGVDTMTLTLAATSTTDNIFVLAFETSTAITTTPSNPAALSMFLRVDAVSGDIRTYGLRAQPRTSAGPVVPGSVAVRTAAADSIFRRFTADFPASTPGWSDPTIGRLQPNFYLTCGVGVAASVTLTIGWPTCEVGVLGATTPILPPVGSPAATTRGADVCTLSYPSGGTVLVSGEMGSLATGTRQTVVDWSDGTTSNRVALRAMANHPSLDAVRTISGTSAPLAALTETALENSFAAALSVGADGAVRAQARGQEPHTLPASAVNLTTLRLGSDASGGEQGAILFHEIRLLPAPLDTSGLEGWQHLLTPRRLFAPLTLTRPQVSVQGTFLLPDGVTWLPSLADEHRFQGAAQRLLLEGARTNHVSNPRSEGLVAGSPGTAPTTWTMSFAATTNGLTRNIVGTQVVDGVMCLVVELSGTATAASTFDIGMTLTDAVVTATGEVWTVSNFVALLSGSMSGVTPRNAAVEANSSGTALTTQVGTVRTVTSTLTRFSDTFTMGHASVLRVQPRWRLTIANGTNLTTPLRIAVGWPQLERAAFASSPILPAVGAPAVSTRLADVLSTSLTNLGIPVNGACTIIWRGVLPQAAPAGVDQMLLQLDDGSDSNRYRVRNPAGGSTIVAGRVTAGASVDATSAGSMTPGSLFTVAVAINGSGRIAISLNGAAAQVATGGVTTGLLNLRIGNNFSGTAPLAGEVESLRFIPGVALSDGLLATYSATLPGTGSNAVASLISSLAPLRDGRPIIGVTANGQSRAAMHVGGTPVFVSGGQSVKEPAVLMLETPGMPSTHPYEDRFYREAAYRLRPLLDNPAALPGYELNRMRTLGQSLSGAARHLAWRDRTLNLPQRNYLHSTLGQGGSRIDQLGRNAGLFTAAAWGTYVCYDRESEALYTIDRRVRLQRGVPLDIRYYMWLQGANDITAGTPAATYTSRLLSFFASRRADIMAITGQATAPFILIEQEVPYGVNNSQSGAIQNAQADLHGGNGGLDVVIGPGYWLPFKDTGHYSAEGVDLRADSIGWWIAEFERTGTWPPLLDIISHSVVGNDIILTYRDTGTALQWDTTTIPSATNMGFSVFAGAPTITNVALGSAGSRTVIITCSSSPTGITLDYATRGPGNAGGTTGYAEGYGNLRDGRSLTSVLQPSLTIFPGFALARRRVI